MNVRKKADNFCLKNYSLSTINANQGLKSGVENQQVTD